MPKYENVADKDSARILGCDQDFTFSLSVVNLNFAINRHEAI